MIFDLGPSCSLEVKPILCIHIYMYICVIINMYVADMYMYLLELEPVERPLRRLVSGVIVQGLGGLGVWL